MLNSLAFKRRPVLGLDLNATSVKILELSSLRRTRCITGYSDLLFSATSPSGDVIHDVGVLSEHIRFVYERVPFCTKQVALAIPDSLVMTKTVSMSRRLKNTEMVQLLAIETEQLVPYPLDEVYFDFSVQSVHEADSSLYDVLLVVARKEHIDQRVAAVTAAGLEVRCVDVASYAVTRALNLLLHPLVMPEKKLITVFVDINTECMQLFVFKEDKIIFSREDLWASTQLLEVLSICEQQWFNQHCSEVLFPFYEMLLMQVMHSLQLFYSSNVGERVDRLIIAGLAATHPGFATCLQKSLGIEVHIANPLSLMSVHSAVDCNVLKHKASSLMVACGLALRT